MRVCFFELDGLSLAHLLLSLRLIDGWYIRVGRCPTYIERIHTGLGHGSWGRAGMAGQRSKAGQKYGRQEELHTDAFLSKVRRSLPPPLPPSITGRGADFFFSPIGNEIRYFELACS